MDFAQIVRKTWDENILFSVLVELTYRCNLDCFFCYNDVHLAGQPMAREEYFRFFQDLADLQVFNLVLTGGEPLAHPEFFALGAKARELGFVVRVKSNGHALRGALLRRLRQEVDPFLVEVSLHGACAATHDRQTRVPGSFDRLLANLGEMVAAGQRLKINSTMTAWNETEVEGMFAIARELGVPLQMDPVVTPRDNGDTAPLAIAPSRDGVRRLLALQQEQAERARAALAQDGVVGETLSVGRQADELMPLAAVSDKHCGAGSSGVAVDPFGNVYPCVQWRRPIGNLHERSIRELWHGSEDLREVRSLTRDVKRHLGARGTTMNFCPGQAVLETGSPLGVYAAAERRAAVHEELDGEARRRPLLPVVA